MTPIPFFLVPLALASGFVIGWLLSWMRGGETRRRLRDIRIVLNSFDLSMVVSNKLPDVLRMSAICSEGQILVGNIHRALSGKERK